MTAENMIENRTFDELQVGDTASVTRTLDEEASSWVSKCRPAGLWLDSQSRTNRVRPIWASGNYYRTESARWRASLIRTCCVDFPGQPPEY
ncbi:MAG: hypothetical protein E6R12_06080 [Sphingomonadales bacterium]|nr:MAG: hypothetical protein E6R12_06080 [Sphingomonadales bacterium]